MNAQLIREEIESLLVLEQMMLERHARERTTLNRLRAEIESRCDHSETRTHNTEQNGITALYQSTECLICGGTVD